MPSGRAADLIVGRDRRVHPHPHAALEREQPIATTESPPAAPSTAPRDCSTSCGMCAAVALIRSWPGAVAGSSHGEPNRKGLASPRREGRHVAACSTCPARDWYAARRSRATANTSDAARTCSSMSCRTRARHRLERARCGPSRSTVAFCSLLRLECCHDSDEEVHTTKTPTK